VGQEVFVRFYRSLDRFRGESKLRTYLTRIAINLSLNALKKRRRTLARVTRVEDEDALGSSNETERKVEEIDRAGFVREAIDDLDPKFRAVVVLRLIEGYSTRETAEIMSIPLGTVLSRLARAQEKLKTKLSPYIKDDEA
jgi:RNA polymerase sigma-70 factor (ECF subfamily)